MCVGFDQLPHQLLDEDDMVSDSVTDAATQQSIKKYIDDSASPDGDGTRVTHGSAITITTATNTILPFDLELFDDNDLHDLVTNNSRLTAVVAGRYFISAAVSWAQVVTGTREIHIKMNGSAIIGLRKSKATEADLFVQGLSIIYNLAADDYVEVQVFHSRGSNLNINSAGNYTPIFMMQRLRDQ